MTDAPLSRTLARLGLLLLLAVAAALLAIATGAAGLPLRDVLAVLAGGGDATARTTVLKL
jgi:hypothetical protein